MGTRAFLPAREAARPLFFCAETGEPHTAPPHRIDPARPCSAGAGGTTAPQGKTALHGKTAPHGRRVQFDGASPSPDADLAAGGACRFFHALISARRAARSARWRIALARRRLGGGRRVQFDGASPSPGADLAAGGAEGVSRGADLAAGGACRLFHALISARRAAMRASVPSSVGR